MRKMREQQINDYMKYYGCNLLQYSIVLDVKGNDQTIGYIVNMSYTIGMMRTTREEKDDCKKSQDGTPFCTCII